MRFQVRVDDGHALVMEAGHRAEYVSAGLHGTVDDQPGRGVSYVQSQDSIGHVSRREMFSESSICLSFRRKAGVRGDPSEDRVDLLQGQGRPPFRVVIHPRDDDAPEEVELPAEGWVIQSSFTCDSRCESMIAEFWRW